MILKKQPIINLEELAWKSLEIVRRVGLANKSHIDTRLIDYGERLQLFTNYEIKRAKREYERNQCFGKVLNRIKSYFLLEYFSLFILIRSKLNVINMKAII